MGYNPTGQKDEKSYGASSVVGLHPIARRQPVLVAFRHYKQFMAGSAHSEPFNKGNEKNQFPIDGSHFARLYAGSGRHFFLVLGEVGLHPIAGKCAITQNAFMAIRQNTTRQSEARMKKLPTGLKRGKAVLFVALRVQNQLD